jgi:NAD-dependent DNA ligase
VAEAEVLEKWLVANAQITNQPIIRLLYERVRGVLADAVIDADEQKDLLDALGSFSGRDHELGEALKATTLPLCQPPPSLSFEGRRYCFTGTFMFGQRKDCEKAVVDRAGSCGSLTMKTNFLVIGAYATDTWKHSAFGLKIMRAVQYRDEKGLPIGIVAEEHWRKSLA